VAQEVLSSQEEVDHVDPNHPHVRAVAVEDRNLAWAAWVHYVPNEVHRDHLGNHHTDLAAEADHHSRYRNAVAVEALRVALHDAGGDVPDDDDAIDVSAVLSCLHCHHHHHHHHVPKKIDPPRERKMTRTTMVPCHDCHLCVSLPGFLPSSLSDDDGDSLAWP
jgi:hypothetical protein